MDFLFGRRNSREQEWRDLQKNGGGQGKSPTKSSQKDLCEVSHRRDRRRSSPSHPILSLYASATSVSQKLDLRTTTQAHRKRWFHAPVLRKNMRASTSADLQVPILPLPWQVSVQRILWARACQVNSPIPPPSLHFLHQQLTGSAETLFNKVTQPHVWNVAGNLKRSETCAWDATAPSESWPNHD